MNENMSINLFNFRVGKLHIVIRYKEFALCINDHHTWTRWPIIQLHEWRWLERLRKDYDNGQR